MQTWECAVFTSASAKQNYMDEGKFVDTDTAMSRLALGDHTEMPDHILQETLLPCLRLLMPMSSSPVGKRMDSKLTGLQSI